MGLFGLGDKKKIEKQIETSKTKDANKPDNKAKLAAEGPLKGLEKRMDELEKYTVKNIDAMNKFADSVNVAMARIRKENEILKKQKAVAAKPVRISKDKKQQLEEIDLPDEVIGAVEEEPVKEEIETIEDEGNGYGGRKIETSLDALYELVVNKGKVRVTDAAKTLKVSVKQVEEWAHILEVHNLAEVHYPAVGKPVIKKK